MPALGSDSPLDHTTSHRIMNAVYRNGSIWTCHDVGTGGRSAYRWYEIDAGTLMTNQVGTISDPSLHYFYCSIAVNSRNDVAMGFSGSNEDQYAGCYYTGRLAGDPAGETAPPVQYREGTGPQNDGIGRNRWGDYSFTAVDPADDRTFWTLQEYGHDDNIWGTYGAVLEPVGPCVEDLDGSGNVDIADLLAILTAWGNAGGSEDLDGSGTVDIGDLVLLLTAWGPC